ncbi:MAG TPA: BON domain-containing protein [Kofleriaceae bacterium]|nr:BON domain-containing protein [Kofleriaceae bacterium]
MSRKSARIPKSYEEIVRQTVVDPDSTPRPSLEQEKASREGFRALDPEEEALQQRVLAALATSGADISRVTVEVARDRVTLLGRVPDVAMLSSLENAVARVPGVETIHNQVVVDAGPSAD